MTKAVEQLKYYETWIEWNGWQPPDDSSDRSFDAVRVARDQIRSFGVDPSDRDAVQRAYEDALFACV